MMNETKRKYVRAIIASINSKGGCGKTTSIFHIAGELVRRGRKVLVIDVDPQGNLTDFLLAEEESDYDREASNNVLDWILGEKTFEEVVKKNYIKAGNNKPKYMGIDVLPASRDLKDNDKYSEILGSMNLKNAFNEVEYDYILIDCPPCNQMVERLVLEQLATHILIPMSSDISCVDGVGEIISEIDKARIKNPELKVIGMFFSMYIRRFNNNKFYFTNMARMFSNLFIKEYIPFQPDVIESKETEGRPLAFYRKSTATAHVERLVSEILSRL